MKEARRHYDRANALLCPVAPGKTRDEQDRDNIHAIAHALCSIVLVMSTALSEYTGIRRYDFSNEEPGEENT